METENDRKMKFFGLAKEALANQVLMKGVEGQLWSEALIRESPKLLSLFGEQEEKRVFNSERLS